MEGYYMERAEKRRIHRLQREKQVKRQRFIMIIILFMIVLIAAVFSISRFTYASSDIVTQPRAKYYKSILIYQDDTLYSIAESYMSQEYKDAAQYINEVKNMNHMLNNTITTGDYLIIPYYSANIS